MHKSLIGLAAAASIGLAALAVPSTANAGCYGCAVGAGVLGGVAAGAIIGSAIANNPPPPPGLLSAAARLRPATIRRRARLRQLAPGCHWGHRRVWVEGYGYQVRHGSSLSLISLVDLDPNGIRRPACTSRPVFFCGCHDRHVCRLNRATA